MDGKKVWSENQENEVHRVNLYFILYYLFWQKEMRKKNEIQIINKKEKKKEKVKMKELWKMMTKNKIDRIINERCWD